MTLIEYHCISTCCYRTNYTLMIKYIFFCSKILVSFILKDLKIPFSNFNEFNRHTFDWSIRRKICNSDRSVFAHPQGHPRLYPIFGSYLNCRRFRLLIAYCLKHGRQTWWLQLNVIVNSLEKNQTKYQTCIIFSFYFSCKQIQHSSRIDDKHVSKTLVVTWQAI